MIIIYITLFSYSLIAFYNDYVNVKPKAKKQNTEINLLQRLKNLYTLYKNES